MKNRSRHFLLFLVFSSLLTLSGCFYTLKPIYTAKDIIFDESLVGVWELNDRTLTFTKDDDENRYELVYSLTDNKGTHEQQYVVHLIQLDGRKFLDFYPSQGGAPKYLSPVMPMHAIALVNQIEPTLKIAFLNSEWLTGGSVPLTEDFIYTGTTEEIQRLLRKLSDRPNEAFIPLEFRRR
jgi:hypothetical protein